MGLFKSRDAKASAAQPPAQASASAPGLPQKKDRPTPSRREAEAARMARFHPELDAKTAKRMEREARASERVKQTMAYEENPARQLMRDVVDARFNLGEIALPAMMVMLVVMMLPIATTYQGPLLVITYGFIVLLILDTYLTWRSFKKVAAVKLPGTSLKGMAFYGFNRQISFRRWRQPAPRVKRGDKIE